MFGLSGLQLIAAIGAIAFSIGSASGALVTSKFYVSAQQKQEIKNLETKMAAKDARIAAETAARIETKGKLDVLDRVSKKLADNVTDGNCFDASDDVDAVRDLLNQSYSITDKPRT